MSVLQVLFFVAIAAAVLYQTITSAAPRFFLVPPQLWKDKIRQVVEYPTAIYLKVGKKRSSYRRRLITSSAEPWFYNNFTNNKIKLHPTDSQNEDNFFLNGLVRRDVTDPQRKVLYGFFHPYATNGGGGEKVLWEAVKATLLANERNIAVVYTANLALEPNAILTKVASQFNITMDGKRVVFIYLRYFPKYIDNSFWKAFTLLGQFIGALLLGLEALYELSPDIWIDTMGLPGSYWWTDRILQIPIVAYVHYPVLQQDMFNKLGYSHPIKRIYWSVLYYLYVYLGSLVDVTLANGSWTLNHIKEIWFLNVRQGSTVSILYPPCGTESITVSEGPRSDYLYIAQFRPEKRHSLILDEYHKFLAANKSIRVAELPKLVFAGSCRTADDTDTLTGLQQKVSELQLHDHVKFVVDASYDEIRQLLATAKFGLNAMWNEHFGIGVVEYMAAGVVPVVHASAGPLLDIAGDSEVSDWKSDIGFFFKSKEDPDYTESLFPELAEVFERLLSVDVASMREAGVQKASKFSDLRFRQQWIEYARALDVLEKYYRLERRGTVENVY